MEIVGVSWRARVKVITGATWGIGVILVGGVAYAVPEWSMLIIIGTAHNLPLVLYFW